jgi:tetratricopeptide (TPR) repeat protein
MEAATQEGVQPLKIHAPKRPGLANEVQPLWESQHHNRRVSAKYECVMKGVVVGLLTAFALNACATMERREAESVQADLRVFLNETNQALASCEEQLAGQSDSTIEILGEASQLCFILGSLGEKQEGEKWFQKGQYYAELLCRERPDRVECHYWFALNLAGLAEVGGPGRALRLVPVIVAKLQTALAIDENYDHAGAHRVLGRIRYAAPLWPLSEGDLDQSLQHLLAAVQIAPENSTNHLYLAETLMHLGKDEEAVRELKWAATSTRHAVWPFGFEDDQQEALRLIMRYESAGNEKKRLEKTEILALPRDVH